MGRKKRKAARIPPPEAPSRGGSPKIIAGLVGVVAVAMLAWYLSSSAVTSGELTGARGRTARPYAIGYEVTAVHPHDPDAYTQGLYYEDGFLYEGTGLNGSSVLRQVDIATGDALREVALPDQFFGEGIATFGDRIYQLTWQAHFGFLYDKQTFKVTGRFSYPTEGWGLTTDGTHLVLSDGSASLFFRDPETFEEIRRIEVREGDRSVDQLNELEYIEGDIYANIWHSNQIVRISTDSGEVLGRLDLTELVSRVDVRDPEGVLNGIAYDADGDRLFITGKLWPSLFEIRLDP